MEARLWELPGRALRHPIKHRVIENIRGRLKNLS